MSKIRKPNNLKARVERSCRALVRTNHVAMVNIDPSGRQGMINYKSLKNIAPGRIGQAVCEITHRWTIYLSALCDDHKGNRYLKSIEVAPDGMYLSDHLEEVIEHCYSEIRDSANPMHLVASGWIAILDVISLPEAQAYRIFEAVGAWHQVKVAARKQGTDHKYVEVGQTGAVNGHLQNFCKSQIAKRGHRFRCPSRPPSRADFV